MKPSKGSDFTVEEGEVFGLLGPNGAGKTQTISMLTSVIEPTSGTARIGGFDIRNQRDQAKKINGLVPQDLALYPTLSARANLNFFGRIYGLRGKDLKQRVDDVLRIVALTERADQAVEKYSGGMKRRVNIGAGLLHHPRLFFLDEPTVGVDPQSRNQIFESVQQLNRERGMSIIYTSHYMEEVEFLCNRVAIVDSGRIIAIDTIKNLVAMLGGGVIQLGLESSGRGAAERPVRAARREAGQPRRAATHSGRRTSVQGASGEDRMREQPAGAGQRRLVSGIAQPHHHCAGDAGAQSGERVLAPHRQEPARLRGDIMNLFNITYKDLQVFIRDRGSMFTLFLLPFVFILVLSLAMQGMKLGETPAATGPAALPLTVVNNDPQGQAAQNFLTALQAGGKVNIVLEDQATVEDRMTDAALRYALFIPADFSTQLAAGQQTTLRLAVHPINDQVDMQTVERAVARASREYMISEYLNAGLEQMAAMQAADPNADTVFSKERIQQQVAVQGVAAAEHPLIKVVTIAPAKPGDEMKAALSIPTYSEFAVVGMTVLFVFMVAQAHRPIDLR